LAGEPDIVGRATGLRRVPGGAGYLDRRLTLVTRDRFHPNADDLEIVGGVHAHGLGLDGSAIPQAQLVK
jgi:hypothetical protein